MRKPIEFTKEWCMRSAEIEGDAEIGAGSLAALSWELVECSRCSGLGRIYGGHDSDPSDYGGCPVCNGSGQMEVETFPANEADIMAPAHAQTKGEG